MGRLAPGQGDLRRSSPALLRGGHACRRICLALGELEGGCDLCLQPGDGGLHIFQHSKLFDECSGGLMGLN